MKEVWDVIGIMFTIIGWYLTGIISIGVFNILLEPSFNYNNLNKTTAKLLALALLGPIIFFFVLAYALYILMILLIRREWGTILYSAQYTLIGFKDFPIAVSEDIQLVIERKPEDDSQDFPTVSP